MSDLDKTDLKKRIHEHEAVLAYFFSNKCAPCISLRPKISELINQKFPKMKLFLIESETEPKLSADYQVFASPTIILFFDGKETRRFSKYISTAELEESIERYYHMIFN